MNQAYSDEVLKLNPGLQALVKTIPASKYHNARAEARGMRFQSGREASEVGKLIIAEERKAGVFGLRLQVKFPLQGLNSYTADAVYLDENLVVHIIEIKGYETPEWKIKRKLFESKYNHKIEVIK